LLCHAITLAAAPGEGIRENADGGSARLLIVVPSYEPNQRESRSLSN